MWNLDDQRSVTLGMPLLITLIALPQIQGRLGNLVWKIERAAGSILIANWLLDCVAVHYKVKSMRADE